MNNFAQASRKGLLFPSTIGNLTVTQLWTLPTSKLIDMEDSLKESVEKGESKLSRRKRVIKSTEQSENELRLSIVSEILDIREAEEEAVAKQKDLKKEEQELLSLLAKLEEKEKESLSKEEILAKLEALKK